MYAIATGRAERNPVPDLRGAIQTPTIGHYAYLKENELPEFLKKLETYDGHPQTRLALESSSPHVRPDNRVEGGGMV